MLVLHIDVWTLGLSTYLVAAFLMFPGHLHPKFWPALSARQGVHPKAAALVQVKKGKLFVNGKPRCEKYINEEPKYMLKQLKVPPGHIFVMGDKPKQQL